jgi:hypothetical protein
MSITSSLVTPWRSRVEELKHLAGSTTFDRLVNLEILHSVQDDCAKQHTIKTATPFYSSLHTTTPTNTQLPHLFAGYKNVTRIKRLKRSHGHTNSVILSKAKDLLKADH